MRGRPLTDTCEWLLAV